VSRAEEHVGQNKAPADSPSAPSNSLSCAADHKLGVRGIERRGMRDESRMAKGSLANAYSSNFERILPFHNEFYAIEQLCAIYHGY
jgi:hypothetical protein